MRKPSQLLFARCFCTAIVGGGLIVALSGPAAIAQGIPGAQYQPATPTISPYAGLSQTNLGPLPNYYSLVRPRQQQRAFNQQVQTTARVQSLQIQALSAGTPQQPQPSQTGKAAGFMQHLHYYPPVKPVARR